MNCPASLSVMIIISWNLPSIIGVVPLGVDILVEMIATHGLPSIYVFDEEHERDVRVRSKYLLYNINEIASSLGHILKQTMENDPPAGLQSSLNFIVFCGKRCIDKLFQTATDIDDIVGKRSMLRHFSTWLIISPELPVVTNVTLDHVAWLTIDSELQSQPKIISTPWQRFLMGKHKNFQNSSRMSIRDLSSLVWTPGGRQWASVDLCNPSYSSIFPNFKRGLNGRQLRATALEWSPYTIRTLTKGKVTYVGAAVDMFHILADKFNFCFVIEEPPDKIWGQALDNITLTGIIGQVNRAEVDFCVVPYAVSINREKFTDMSYPVIDSVYNALYTRINDENTWAYLVSAFSWRTYLVGAGTWLIVLGLAFIWVFVSSGITEQARLRFMFEIGFSIPFRQNIDMLNNVFGSSSRMLIFSWQMFCFLITTIYIGNLVAFATVDKQTMPFDTLEDIANQQQYPVGVMDGGYAQGMVMTSTDPVLKNIITKVVHINTTIYEDHNQMLQNLIQKKYILMSPVTYTNVLKALSCEILMTQKSFFSINSGFLFPPFSPLKQIFENEFLQMRDFGTIYKLLSKWTPKAMECGIKEADPRFQFKHMNTVGVVVSALVFVAFCILLLELFRKKMFLNCK